MKKLFLFVAAVFSFCFAGCTAKKSVEVSEQALSLKDITGDWTLESMTGFEGDKLIPVTFSVNPDTESEDSDMYLVSGNSGVNTFFAVIKDENPFPLADKLAQTKMMGAPDEMAFEDALTNNFATASDWKVDSDGKLVIKNENCTIIFKK